MMLRSVVREGEEASYQHAQCFFPSAAWGFLAKKSGLTFANEGSDWTPWPLPGVELAVMVA